ncbi:MAG: hypothetical protein H8E57_04865 [Candidatus Cloacimonetes bacterium]|nr:hypothetical protein [Candidatus Cloacimonadota bacterium]
MIRYRKPENDLTRRLTLNTARNTAIQDRNAGRNYVQQDTIDALSELIPEFKDANRTMRAKMEIRMKEIREKNEAFAFLILTCRDFWEVGKRRTVRLQHPPEVLTYFDLPLTGIVPNPTRNKEWLSIAEKQIKGNERAVANGYPAMSNPSAGEVQDALTIALSQYSDVAMADREYDLAQERLAELRKTVDELLKEVFLQLKFNLRHFDKSSQRRVMRTYGFKFEYFTRKEATEADHNSLQ